MAAPHKRAKASGLNTSVEDFAELLEPGVHHVIFLHDAWCPGVHGDGINCICNPTIEKLTEQAWSESFTATQNRAQRRKAAREAKKARGAR
jgi:hypothetical protein